MRKRVRWLLSVMLALAMLCSVTRTAFAAGLAEPEVSETDIEAEAEQDNEAETEIGLEAEDDETFETKPGDEVDEYIAPGTWSDAEPYFTDEVPEIPDFFSWFRPFALVDECPSYDEAYRAMMALQKEFPAGMTWTNFEPYGSKGDLGESYAFNGGAIKGARYGVGCAAFCFIISDRVFGNLPARVIDDVKYEDIRVGDFLRVNNSHFVTVLQVTESGVIVAEGNYNKSVHWGRAISKADLMNSVNFLVTRYPVGYSEEDNPDEIVDSGTEGGLSWTLTKGGKLTISGSGAMPDYTDSRPTWEQSGKPISSVEIEPGVTSVGNNAFFQRKGLLGVSLPNTIGSIGTNAFNGSDLVGIAVPGSCKIVGNDAFGYCTNLTSVDLAEGVEIVGERVFRGCTSLGYMVFPSSIKSVGAGTFFDCTNSLRQVRFMPNANGVVIGDNLFTRCWNLNYVSLPEGITKLPAGLFQSCLTVVALYIPGTVTSLDEAGKDGPFMNSAVGTVYFGGTQEQWSKLMAGISVQTTATTLSRATIIVDQKDPFAPIPDDPGDITFRCGEEHVGENVDGRCSVCGGLMSEKPGTEPVEPVNPTPTEHTHAWMEDFSHDTTHHWHECEGASCPITENSQKDGYKSHEYGDWVEDLAATTDEEGLRHRNCTVCGHEQVETIPATGGSSGPVVPDAPIVPVVPVVPGTSTPSRPGTTSNTSTTTTVKNPDGSTVTTVRNSDGSTTVMVRAENDQLARVIIPVASAAAASAAGTVAMIVKADGTLSVVKTSVLTDDGVKLALPSGTTTVKVVDNSKDFADVPTGAWYENAVDFVSARELFSGTSATTFASDALMTRAMLVTVLARLEGVDTNGGATWYAKAIEWAMANGVSDGSSPEREITREQLLTMLWRYVGSPTAGSNALRDYADAGNISGYAWEAMNWAVENGIVKGFGDGQGFGGRRLDPQGRATRAQVAEILMNFIKMHYS